MKKRIVIVVGLSALLGTSGCFNNPTDDIYNKEAEVIETTQNSTDSETSSAVTAEVGETLEPAAEEGNENVTSDVYEDETQLELVTVGELNVTEVISADINDPVLKEKMSQFLDPFYFSLYFGEKDYTETGITEEDMVLFALSYCYLYENQAYKFDTDTFKLYVPEERVYELVEKYFGVMLSGHHSILNEEANIAIDFNGGYYLVPTSDKGWNDTMRIDSIKKAGDFAYEVIFTIIDIEGQPSVSKTVILETREDRFILTHYADAPLQTEDVLVNSEES